MDHNRFVCHDRGVSYVSLSYAHGARVTRKTAEEGVGRDKKRDQLFGAKSHYGMAAGIGRLVVILGPR